MKVISVVGTLLVVSSVVYLIYAVWFILKKWIKR